MATLDLSKFAVGGATRPDSFSGLDPAFLQSLQAMIADAPPQIQQNLRIMSGFRSPERQAQLWQGALAKYGSPEAARKWVAPPGNSQHNHGNAVDFRFLDPAAREYAHANAAKYGLNFPMSYEPWHVEPIGARHGQPAPKSPGGFANLVVPASERTFATKPVMPDGPKGQEAAPPPLTQGKPVNDYPVANPMEQSIDVAGAPAPGQMAPESGLGKLFAALAPAAGAMQPAAPQGGPTQSFGSGDPMGATMAAQAMAEKGRGLASGLMPDISALLALGKRPQVVS